MNRDQLDAFLSDIKIPQHDRDQIVALCTEEQFTSIVSFFRLMTVQDPTMASGGWGNQGSKVLTNEQTLELRLFVYGLMQLYQTTRLVRDPDGTPT